MAPTDNPTIFTSTEPTEAPTPEPTEVSPGYVSTGQWVQLGEDIEGITGFFNHKSLALVTDSDDMYLAIGSGKPNSTELQNGTVQVYSYNGTDWIQLGNDIISSTKQNFGESVSISLRTDVPVLAAGAPEQVGDTNAYVEIFEYPNATVGWTSQGKITGHLPHDAFGSSTDFGDTYSIIIGAPGPGTSSPRGYAAVYVQESGTTTWTQRGQNISTSLSTSNIDFGSSVGLSDDGNTIVIGEPFETDISPGYVHVFEYNSSIDDWVPKGSTIQGHNNSDHAGCSVAINHDGTIVAFGAKNHKPYQSNNNDGQVRVYYYDNSAEDWVQMGSSLNGNLNSNEWFGQEISLSFSGYEIAVGAIYFQDENDPNIYRGRVQLFSFDGNDWDEKGDALVGTSPDTFLGWGVSFTEESNTVAIGKVTGGNTDAVIPLPTAVQVYQWVESSDGSGSGSGLVIPTVQSTAFPTISPTAVPTSTPTSAPTTSTPTTSTPTTSTPTSTQRPVHLRPVHLRPVHLRPVHLRPVHLRPVHLRPVHRPVHLRPVHRPVHLRPVHRPVHLRPVHRPVHLRPVHRPVHLRPVHRPVHLRPVHRPVHLRPVHRPVHLRPVHRPVHLRPSTPTTSTPTSTPTTSTPTSTPTTSTPTTSTPTTSTLRPVHLRPVHRPVHLRPAHRPVHLRPVHRPVHLRPVHRPKTYYQFTSHLITHQLSLPAHRPVHRPKTLPVHIPPYHPQLSLPVHRPVFRQGTRPVHLLGDILFTNGPWMKAMIIR